MKLKHLFLVVPPALLIGSGAANAGETINEAGAIACINDKWDEKEVEKGHKLVDYAADAFTSPTIRPRRSQRTVWESTSTCLMKVGRALGPAPTPIKVETRHP